MLNTHVRVHFPRCVAACVRPNLPRFLPATRQATEPHRERERRSAHTTRTRTGGAGRAGRRTCAQRSRGGRGLMGDARTADARVPSSTPVFGTAAAAAPLMGTGSRTHGPSRGVSREGDTHEVLDGILDRRLHTHNTTRGAGGRPCQRGAEGWPSARSRACAPVPAPSPAPPRPPRLCRARLCEQPRERQRAPRARVDRTQGARNLQADTGAARTMVREAARAGPAACLLLRLPPPSRCQSRRVVPQIVKSCAMKLKNFSPGCKPLGLPLTAPAGTCCCQPSVLKTSPSDPDQSPAAGALRERWSAARGDCQIAPPAFFKIFTSRAPRR